MGGASRTVHLIDASAYVFRAYFSLPATMVGRDGQPAQAVHGFADFLIRYLRAERPTHVAVAFDESLTTSFRNEIFPAYKTHRELPPPELEAQLGGCRHVASALGLATLVDDRYEADDLIATLHARVTKRGHRAVVVSPDKDLAQLVDDATELYDYARGERLGPAEVRARFGVTPEQIADLLALAGDPVDGIPGVPGIGRTTATRLLEHFPSLDAIYAGLDAVPTLPIRGAAGVARKLAAGRELAELSRRLTRLARDAPAPARLDALAVRDPDPARVDAVFERWRLGRLRDRVRAPVRGTSPG